MTLNAEMLADGAATGISRRALVRIVRASREAEVYWMQYSPLPCRGDAMRLTQPIDLYDVEPTLSGWGCDIGDLRWVSYVGLPARANPFRPEPLEAEPLEPEPSARDDKRGVYFIGASGMVKIGVSHRPAERMAGIQSYSPVRLKLLAVVRGGIVMEKYLHRRFRRARSHGEWFHLTPEICEYLDRLIEQQATAGKEAA